MSRWFRFYSDAMRNPKVASLSDRDFRTWVGLLSIASENDGKIPPAETAKKLLSMRLDHLLAAIYRLSKAGLINELEGFYEPHNWNKFQYKSDTSNERVTLHRAKKANASVTPPETDTDSVSKDTGASADSDKEFWDSAKAYLSKSGVPRPGGIIGKWVRDHGQNETSRAITAAQVERAVDPVPYIQRVLKKKGNGSGPVVGI